METILNESLKVYPGYPKPSYATFNGSDDKLYRAVSEFNGSRHAGYIKAFWNVIAGTNMIFTTSAESANTKYSALQIVNGQIIFVIYRAVGGINQVKSGAAAVSYGWHEIEFGTTNGTGYYMKLDGNAISFTTTSADDGMWFADIVAGRVNISIGFLDRSTDAPGVGGGSYVEVDGLNKWILTGVGKYCYDTIGSLHLAYSGTGSKVAYSKSASWHLLQTKGYSLFTKTGELDEYVPYTEAGQPQNPIELAAYTHQYDVAGNLTNYNFAPSIIDFNPAALLDTKLAIFDKSNATIHIATASMFHYNALATCEWRNDELKTFTIYSGYFNSGYEGQLFLNIADNLLLNLFNYHTNKTGNDLARIKTFCGIP